MGGIYPTLAALSRVDVCKGLRKDQRRKDAAGTHKEDKQDDRTLHKAQAEDIHKVLAVEDGDGRKVQEDSAAAVEERNQSLAQIKPIQGEKDDLFEGFESSLASHVPTQPRDANTDERVFEADSGQDGNTADGVRNRPQTMAELDAGGAVDIDLLDEKVLPDADGVVAAVVQAEADPVDMKRRPEAALWIVGAVDVHDRQNPNIDLTAKIDCEQDFLRHLPLVG